MIGVLAFTMTQLTGLVIVGMVGVLLSISILSSLRRMAHETMQQRRAAKILDARLESEKLKHYKIEEEKTLLWNGFRKFKIIRKQYENKVQPKGPALIATGANQEHEINKDEVLVGRLKTADIIVSHNTVSGAHAKIYSKRSELFLEDLLSTNKTRVNGEELRPQIRVKLKHGDTVHFGDAEFSVRLSSATGAAALSGAICSFYMAPHDGKALPSFEPGQYLTFQFKVPDQPRPVVRCYSLSDGPSPEYYRISVKREFRKDGTPGVASNFLHDHIEEGDIIDVKAPGGKFFLDMNSQQPVVLIGGGIGITPVLSMVNTLVARKSKREIWFFYGLRNGKEHVFKKHLETLAMEHDNIHLHVCYSRPDAEDVKGRDYHHKGRVGVELFQRLLPSNNFGYLMCGPGPMMDSVVTGLEEWGVPKKDVHYEAFGPATVKSVKKVEQPATGETKAAGVEVKFSKSGTTAKWDPGSGMTLLDLAEANNVTIEFGCRGGSCGTCKTAIRSGEVTYLSDTDSTPDDGTCLACIAVPKTNLEVDA